MDGKKVGWLEDGLVDSVYYNYGYEYTVFNKKGKDVGKVSMSMDSSKGSVNWQEMVGDRKYMESAYDIIGGKYPEKATDVVLVVDSTNTILSTYFSGMGFDSLLDGEEYGGIDLGGMIASGQTFDNIIGNPDKGKEGVTFLLPNNDARFYKTVNSETGKEYYDCFNTMDILDYFKIFFPTASKEEIKELIEKSNKLICQHSMEKFITPDLNELYYKNEKYYEQADMIVDYAQTLYKILKRTKKRK